MVAVIGDIHGCFYTLVELFNKIKEKHQRIQIFCVGDLIDRGKHSYEVIKFIDDENIKFVMGNHDLMFYHFFKEPHSNIAKQWVFNGNAETLESYDTHEDALFKHIQLIKFAPLFYDLDDCFISHAGISNKYADLMYKDNFMQVLPEVIYRDSQHDSGVLWTRHDLLNIKKLQIVGHTRHQDVIFDESANAIYLDTGACEGNKLSSVIVHKNKVLTTISVPTHTKDFL